MHTHLVEENSGRLRVHKQVNPHTHMYYLSVQDNPVNSVRAHQHNRTYTNTHTYTYTYTYKYTVVKKKIVECCAHTNV